MKKTLTVLALLSLLLVACSGSSNLIPSPTPTGIVVSTPTPTPRPSPSGENSWVSPVIMWVGGPADLTPEKAIEMGVPAEYAYQIIPADGFDPMFAGAKINISDWPLIEIYNNNDHETGWSVRFIDLRATGHVYYCTIPYTLGLGPGGKPVRYKDSNQDDIILPPGPVEAKNWVTIHDTEIVRAEVGEQVTLIKQGVMIGPRQSKKVLITLDIPKGAKTPETWAFLINIKDESQTGMQQYEYNQLWQVYMRG